MSSTGRDGTNVLASQGPRYASGASGRYKGGMESGEMIRRGLRPRALEEAPPPSRDAEPGALPALAWANPLADLGARRVQEAVAPTPVRAEAEVRSLLEEVDRLLQARRTPGFSIRIRRERWWRSLLRRLFVRRRTPRIIPLLPRRTTDSLSPRKVRT